MGNIEYYKQFFNTKANKHSIIIEDNNYVAYAYLLYNNDIISEVWLYNKGELKYNNWDNISEEDFPLQNLESYIDKNIAPIIDDSEIEVKWFAVNNIVIVHIFIRNELTAIMKSNNKIGISLLVNTNTPIAKMYTPE